MSTDADSLKPNPTPHPASGTSNTPGIPTLGLQNVNEPGIPSINEPIPSINVPGVSEFSIPAANSPGIPFNELGIQTQVNILVNRERSHGRTLSVPSMPHNFEHHSPARSPSPCLSMASSNMYLSPNIEASHPWSPGSRSGMRGRSASINLPTPAHPKKKVVAACQRCRTRKIKCDGMLPSCGSCVKASVECKEVDKAGERDVPRR